MKIEHRIENSLDLTVLTPEAVLTFRKYSIDGINGDYCIDQRAIQCMEMVIKCIELGLMTDKDIKKEAKILDKIMSHVIKIIADVRRHLESNSKFDSDLYCIDLSKIFDVSDDNLYFPIHYALEDLMHIRNLDSTSDRKKMYVYGWHKAEYFNNEFTQTKINSLCKDAATMIRIENHIKNAEIKDNGNRYIDITDEMPASKIAVCAHFLGMRYDIYDTFVEVYKRRG